MTPKCDQTRHTDLEANKYTRACCVTPVCIVLNVVSASSRDGFGKLRRMLRGVDVNKILRSFSGVCAGGALGVSSSGGEIGALLSIIDTSRASGAGVSTGARFRRVERIEDGLANFFSDISSADSDAGEAAECLWRNELDESSKCKGTDPLLNGCKPFFRLKRPEKTRLCSSEV